MCTCACLWRRPRRSPRSCCTRRSTRTCPRRRRRGRRGSCLAGARAAAAVGAGAEACDARRSDAPVTGTVESCAPPQANLVLGRPCSTLVDVAPFQKHLLLYSPQAQVRDTHTPYPLRVTSESRHRLTELIRVPPLNR